MTHIFPFIQRTWHCTDLPLRATRTPTWWLQDPPMGTRIRTLATAAAARQPTRERPRNIPGGASIWGGHMLSRASLSSTGKTVILVFDVFVDYYQSVHVKQYINTYYCLEWWIEIGLAEISHPFCSKF